MRVTLLYGVANLKFHLSEKKKGKNKRKRKNQNSDTNVVAKGEVQGINLTCGQFKFSI